MEVTYRYSLFTIPTTVLANFRLPGEVRFVEGTRRCLHAPGRRHRRPDGAVRRALVQPDARPPEKRTIRTRTRERPRDGGGVGRPAANPGDTGPQQPPGPEREGTLPPGRGRHAEPHAGGVGDAAEPPRARGPRPLGSWGAARSPSSQRPACCWPPFRPSMRRHTASPASTSTWCPRASVAFRKDTPRWVRGRPARLPLTDDVCAEPAPKQPLSEQ